MTDDSNEKKDGMTLGGVHFSVKEIIYGVILVIGFSLIVSGLNGAMELGLPDALTTAIGATLGVAAAFGLAWLRNR